SFQVSDAATDFLAAGQTLTQKYDVTIKDNTGATAIQTETGTATGRNRAQTITGHTAVGEREDIAVTQGNLNTRGTITYADVNTIDTHTATFAPQAAGYLGTCALNTSSSDAGNGGTVGWSFQVSDAATDFLAAGQTLTQKYDVTIKDNTGATAIQT